MQLQDAFTFHPITITNLCHLNMNMFLLVSSTNVLFPTGTTSQRLLSLLSRDSQRAFPIVCQFTSDTFPSPSAAARMGHASSRRVLNRDVFLCLPDCTASTQAAHVCCSRTLKSGDAHVRSHITKEKPNVRDNLHSVGPLHSSEFVTGLIFTSNRTKTASVTTRTNIMSCADESCLRYTQVRGRNALKSHLIRTPGTPIFCTLPMNAKISLRHHIVRLCHNQSSSKDPREFVSDQTNSDTNSHLDETISAQLTHTDAQGRATMVDVGGKVPARRTATARATIILGPTAFRLLRDNQLAKGDALAVAQLAGIMAAKQTSALIPLCHTLPLDCTSVTFDLNELQNAAVVTATCRTTARTGVEMEALTAVSVAALTVYDMCKALSHDIIITDVKLLSKTGGKRDFHRYP